MKAIFLDVDGELTYSGYENKETHNIDENKVKLLKEIVDSTGAIIVLSSSWRVGYNKETGSKTKYYQVLEQMLNVEGLEISDILSDIRPVIIDTRESLTMEEALHIKCEYGTGRGAEVKKWIDENNPESFVILDDENHCWEDYGLENNWVQSSWYEEDGGLHQEHVDKAIKILNRNQG